MIPMRFLRFRRNVGIASIEKARKRRAIARFQTVVRKRGVKMKGNNRKPRAQTIATVVWSNIVRQQYLLGITDEQLCEVLGVTSRSLYNYRIDPSVLTMRQIQSLLDSFGVEMQTLIIS
jgi:hypothetical protein